MLLKNRRNKLQLILSILALFVLLVQIDCHKETTEDDSNPQLDAILEELSPVCFGQGILNASSFSGYFPHKIVILSSSGEKHEWSYSLPQNWWPTSIEETQLVAVISDQHKETLSTCNYTTALGGFGNTTAVLYRIGWKMYVDLREARSGFIISSTVLHTPLPECPTTWTFSGSSDEKTYNEKVKLDALLEWLRPYVTWFTSNP